MKVRIIKVLSIVIFLYSLSLILYFIKSGQDKIYITGTNRPLVIAHGGSKALFPENTMTAFDGSDSIGVDMLEMDVLMTKDGVLVCHHNETIDNWSNGKGYIKDYTFKELKQFNFGYNFKDLYGNFPYRNQDIQIASLEEVLIKYGYKYPLCIELKNKDLPHGVKAADELHRLILQYNMTDKVIISCFDDNIMHYFKKISEKKVHTATASKETKNLVILSLCYLAQFYFGEDDVIQIPVESSGYHLDKKQVINSAHKKRMAVHYWTINDPYEMKRLIKAGADGLITDRPDIMNQVLTEMGY